MVASLPGVWVSAYRYRHRHRFLHYPLLYESAISHSSQMACSIT